MPVARNSLHKSTGTVSTDKYLLPSIDEAPGLFLSQTFLYLVAFDSSGELGTTVLHYLFHSLTYSFIQQISSYTITKPWELRGNPQENTVTTLRSLESVNISAIAVPIITSSE